MTDSSTDGDQTLLMCATPGIGGQNTMLADPV